MSRRRVLCLHDGSASSVAQCLALGRALRRIGLAAVDDWLVHGAPWPSAGQDLVFKALPVGLVACASVAMGRALWGPREVSARAEEISAAAKERQVGLIIGCGRHTAAINAAIRQQIIRKAQASVHNVQILNPRCWPMISPKLFSAIVTPAHDGLRESRHPNVFNTVGSLSWVDDETLAQVRTNAAHTGSRTSTSAIDLVISGKVKVAFLCGGDTARVEMDPALVESQLLQVLAKAGLPTNACLAVGSRRTPPELFDRLQARGLGVWKAPLVWASRAGVDVDETNPYRVCLALAESFIVTGDSVSMVSDACSTGKPVVIIRQGVDGHKPGSKLARFHDQVKSRGLVAEDLSSRRSHGALREADEAAMFCKRRFAMLDGQQVESF